MNNKELRWQYPNWGQLPSQPTACFVCMIDSAGQVRYGELMFDPKLQCWRDPITGEENEDLQDVNKWVPLLDLIAQIKG